MAMSGLIWIDIRMMNGASIHGIVLESLWRNETDQSLSRCEKWQKIYEEADDILTFHHRKQSHSIGCSERIFSCYYPSILRWIHLNSWNPLENTWFNWLPCLNFIQLICRHIVPLLHTMKMSVAVLFQLSCLSLEWHDFSYDR